MDVVLELVEQWERTALKDEGYGDRSRAAARRECAAELRETLKNLLDRRVTPEEAVIISGFTKGGLANKADVPNVGARNAALYRLGDLPVKRLEFAPGAPTPTLTVVEQIDRLREQSRRDQRRRRDRRRRFGPSRAR